ncbi:MAG: M12 family metallo-peptidase [Dyadobacter sp.]
MKNFFILIAVLFQTVQAQNITPISSPARLSQNESLKLDGFAKSLHVVNLESASLNSFVKRNPLQSKKFQLAVSNDLTLDLTIQQNEIRGAGYKASITTENGEVADSSMATVNTYSGYANNDPNQFVRLYIDKDQIKGIISDGKNGFYAIEPLSTITKSDLSDNRYVVYNTKDVKSTAPGCGIEESVSQVVSKAQSSAREAATVSTQCRILEVATDADFEFYKNNKDNTNARILNDMNIVAGIYMSTFNIKILVTYQHVYATANDPYTSTNPAKLLTEFTNYWNKNHTDVKRDVAHLFTSKFLEGFTLGIAHKGVIGKTPSMAYSLTYGTTNEYLTTAHELGHNFNASHPTDAASGCSEKAPSLMCSSLDDAPMFSEFSKSEINAWIAGNEGALLTSDYNFEILGDSSVCTTTTFRANLFGTSVSWSSSNSTLLSINATTGVAKRIGTGNGLVSITAVIDVCSTPITVTKEVYVGIPEITFSASAPNTDGVITAIMTEVPYATYNWYLDGNLALKGIRNTEDINSGNCGTTHFIQATVKNACGTTPMSNKVSFSWQCTQSGLSVYPNPARDVINLDYSSNSNKEVQPKQIILYNERSDVVRTITNNNTLTANASGSKTQVDVSSLPRGTYYLYVMPNAGSNEKADVKRILLQ